MRGVVGVGADFVQLVGEIDQITGRAIAVFQDVARGVRDLGDAPNAVPREGDTLSTGMRDACSRHSQFIAIQIRQGLQTSLPAHL